MIQLPLPLPAEPSYRAADFVADASNRAARAWLADPGGWPGGRLALAGEAGRGKTHLLRLTAAAHGWPVWAGPALAGLPELPGGIAGLALDDADRVADEAALFHLINLCAERRLPLLLAGRAPPARWPVALADLRSRLRATMAAELDAPSDALLAALLAKHAADRQLAIPAALRAWLLARLPRSAAAMALAVARLDAASLAARGKVTRRLAGQALAEMPGWAAEAAGEDDPAVAGEELGACDGAGRRLHDDSEAAATGVSPPPTPLL